MSRKKFLCRVCGVDTYKTGEMYYLKSDVWPLGSVGMLCVLHCEEAIGRELIPADFTDCWINRNGVKSAKLARRLVGKWERRC